MEHMEDVMVQSMKARSSEEWGIRQPDRWHRDLNTPNTTLKLQPNYLIWLQNLGAFATLYPMGLTFRW